MGLFFFFFFSFSKPTRALDNRGVDRTDDFFFLRACNFFKGENKESGKLVTRIKSHKEPKRRKEEEEEKTNLDDHRRKTILR